MTAYHIVRFRVKPAREEEFLKNNRGGERLAMPGFRRGSMIKTGDHQYCFVGEWNAFDDIVAARPQMSSILDLFRDTLEDLGGGLGVTDPVSGEVVIEVER